MKRIILLSFLLVIVTGVHAQVKTTAAYWVVETNIHERNFSIVRLYDTANKLVHEVKMDGVYFDVARPRHRKMLNQLLRGSFECAEITANKIRKEKITTHKL